MALLEISRLAGGYGELEILRDISISVSDGQLVTLLGTNGAGKTTLTRLVMGLLSTTRGQITFEGEDITRLATHRRAERGLVLVPEGRELFPQMSVAENLEMGATVERARHHYQQNLELVHSLFPVLAARRAQQAGTMSGGEQQMLAVARGLMAKPRLLIIDELSLGLAPRLVAELFVVLAELKRMGQAILLTEQNVQAALGISDYAYILAEGSIALAGPPDVVGAEDEVRHAYLGM